MIKKLGVAAALLAGVGFIPWPVTRGANLLGLYAAHLTGWNLSVEEMVWAPWRLLQVGECRLSSPQGARLHLVGLRVAPKASWILSGRAALQVRVSEIRLDPGSFGLRDRLALELLSAGPVVTQGSALLEWNFREGLVLRELSLEGPLVRARAQGRLAVSREMDWRVDGDLDGRLAAGLRWIGPTTVQDWEPFSIQWVRSGAGAYGSFALRNRNFSWKTNGD